MTRIRASFGPVWAADDDFLELVGAHVLDTKPELILECGSGVSTCLLALCVHQNATGRVYSLEHLPTYARTTRRVLQEVGLANYAQVLEAPLQPYRLKGEMWPWYSLQHLPDSPIRLLVIDGPPKKTCRLARYPAGPLLFSRLGPNAVVFLDDAKRADEQEILAMWQREFSYMPQEFIDSSHGCARLRNDERCSMKDKASRGSS